jgi:hypothetical protein
VQSDVCKTYQVLAREWSAVNSQKRPMNDEYIDMAEKIKEELIITLQRKGIKAPKIHIDLHSDNVNVSISINKES